MTGFFVPNGGREKSPVKCDLFMASAVPTCSSKSLRAYSPCSRQVLGPSFGLNSWNGTSQEDRRCDFSQAHSVRARAICGVLLGFFLLPLFIPFFNLGSESTLPACCRRDGKHHCAMSARLPQLVPTASSEPVVRAVVPTCPYRSRLLMPIVSRMLFVPSAPAFSVPGVSSAALGVETKRVARVSEFRSHLKRGPPSLLT